MYGAQAIRNRYIQDGSFENDVEMYGAQAIFQLVLPCSLFENDVEMYGAQATKNATALY